MLPGNFPVAINEKMLVNTWMHLYTQPEMTLYGTKKSHAYLHGVLSYFD